ncbi:MAG: cell envelope integrity EipB family protein [Alphaproteobacteria bacterium]|nr:cell envelope integrity EipB family protein [Alphaproteobacteria bacterium]
MMLSSGRAFAAICLSFGIAGAAQAVDIAPHRALYSMSLGTAKQNSGVVAAGGSMAFEWGETCDGWTVEQRYKLTMHYAEESDVELTSNFVTWESKDGLRYRFFQRKLKNGDVEDEVRGEARLDGKGQGGKVEFTKPTVSTLELPPGSLFPTAHTILLIERAAAGDQFVAAKVFDGASEENAVDVTAVIGAAQTADAGAAEASVKSPLLQRPSWRMRLAFFPADASADEPDYELGMRLLDNGVSRDMVLDYGDFAIKAQLDKIEAMPKPSC